MTIINGANPPVPLEPIPLEHIQAISFNPGNPARDTARAAQAGRTDPFGGILDAAMAAFNRVNADQQTADALQQQFAAGRSGDILAVMMAQENAYTSLNFTLQVASGALNAYREITRMQV